jgi:hypothetical protein
VSKGEPDLSALFARAERHGLAGVLFDAYVAEEVPLPAGLERELATRAAARACDHAAHLDMLRRIDGALDRAGLAGVALKGALLAERLYERPAARPTTDIDLLVAERDLDEAASALAAIEYTPSNDPSEAHFRNAGHHLHLLHPRAPCIELHFHAYRGFGGVLRSEPLLVRSVSISGYRRVRALAPEDELLYLATHAAGHRFMRLGWLYDLLLLVRRLDDTACATAFARARASGMTRPLALALGLLEELFGWRVSSARDAGDALALRRRLLGTITEEPRWPLARSATRFAYTLALCEDWTAARSYARDAFAYRFGHLVSRVG